MTFDALLRLSFSCLTPAAATWTVISCFWIVMIVRHGPEPERSDANREDAGAQRVLPLQFQINVTRQHDWPTSSHTSNSIGNESCAVEQVHTAEAVDAVVRLASTNERNTRLAAQHKAISLLLLLLLLLWRKNDVGKRQLLDLCLLLLLLLLL